METRLKFLYALQLTDKSLDELQELKGDLPGIVEELSAAVKEKTMKKKELETLVTQSLAARDKSDSEIIDLKAKIEKYKTQQFQVKTNKQYDAIAREIDYSQERITKLQKEMETLEGKAILAKEDAEKLGPGIDELQEQLAENKKELSAINKEHEEEETKLQRQRQKLVAKVIKKDYQTYDRIRKAKDGKAVVPVSRNSCGGCFNRVPPQKVLELRKNNSMLTCERCGRILISDEIVEKRKASVMTIHAFTDGASRGGNPGESGIGVVLRTSEGRVLHSVCGYIGRTTNNIAEYTALLVCLKAAADFDCSELIVHSDSELMVRQLNGQYKIRNENLKKYFQQAQAILRTAEYRAAFRHVVREQNSEADALANRGIDQKIPLTADFRFEQN